MNAPLNASLASIRVGGREYPAVNVQTCRLCSHPHRTVIEKYLVQGWTPARIVRQLEPQDGLTARNVADHLRNAHLPVVAEAVERLREHDAVGRGNAVTPAVDAVVTALEFARRVMVTVDARLAAGDVLPGIQDGLKAAQVLASTEVTGTGDFSQDEVMVAFMSYTMAIKNNCTAEQVRDIGRDLATDPVLRELSAHQERLA